MLGAYHQHFTDRGKLIRCETASRIPSSQSPTLVISTRQWHVPYYHFSLITINTSLVMAPRNTAYHQPRKVRPKVKPTSRTELLVIIGRVSLSCGGPAPRHKVALRAGYGNHTSPAFKMALKRLQQSGFLQDLKLDEECVLLTEKGSKIAMENTLCTIAASNEDAHKEIIGNLSPKMRDLFHLISDGKVHGRDVLAASLGYDSMNEAGFRMLLNRVRLKGYLEFIGKTGIQLSDECFPFGRPQQESSAAG